MMGRVLRAFAGNQSGASATEFAMLLPVLLFVLMGSITAFDMFRTAQNVEKATFTIGDMLAREKGALNATKLGDMLVLLRNTVPSAGDGGLRVSSVARVNGAFVLRWSRSVGLGVPTSPIPANILPEIANGDSVLLTESFVPHQALISGFGIGDITFSAQAAYRPRFLASIAFQ